MIRSAALPRATEAGYNKKMKKPSVPAALAATPLLAGFPAAELAAFAAASERLRYAEGKPIFVPGDPGDRLFIVLSGAVAVEAEDGTTLAEFVSGDSFGELELLTGSKRNATARASGPVELLGFPAGGQPMEKCLAHCPELAARLLRSFLLIISGRTRQANSLVKENSPWVRELRHQVYDDKLTGLLNKAWLDETLGSKLTGPLALVMLKPDNFKDINDRFGHEAGDAALVAMSREFARLVGTAGTAVRYIGNELAAVYPGLDRDGAVAAAKAVQAGLAAMDLTKPTGDPAARFTISLGIALYPEHATDAAGLIKAVVGLPLAGRGRGGSALLFPEDAP
jgi:diguanylate cyclase (GGDEF)-like protein